MSAESGKLSTKRRLTSWKEIAAFLGRDERTVKRWEISRGLPVRRVPGTGRASVFAYADEIELWMRAGPGPLSAMPLAESLAGADHRSPQWSALAGILALAGTGIVVAAIVFAVRSAGRFPSNAPQGSFPANQVAAESFRSGLHAWQTRTPAGIARAIVEFNRAIANDPKYAPAYAGLAETYNLQAEFSAVSPQTAYPRAADAAKRAIALDPSLASAHAALAFVDFYWSRHPRAAEREFRRALALQPENATAHHWYATFLMTTGRFGEALVEIRKAEALDSESSAIPADKALILFHAGQIDRAVKLLTQLEDERPDFGSVHRYLAVVWLAENRDADYLRELKLAAQARGDTTDATLAEAGATGLSGGGHNGMFRAMLDVQRDFYRNGKESAYALAITCAKLGNIRDAFSWLSASVARHEPDNIALAIDPPFQGLHGDARFALLLAGAGLSTGKSSTRGP